MAEQQKKSVTWLTAYAANTLYRINYKDDIRIRKAFNWVKEMQAPSGLLPDFEGAHEDPDGTSIIVEALLDYGEPKNSPVIRRGKARHMELLLLPSCIIQVWLHAEDSFDKKGDHPYSEASASRRGMEPFCRKEK